MKIVYMLVNIFLAAGVLFFAVLHFRLKPSLPEKALSQTPIKTKIEIAGVFDRNAPSPLPDVSGICNNNPFDPARSEDGHSEGAAHAPLKQTGMELVGITEFGDVKGAIIIEKTPPLPNPAHPDAQKTSNRHYYKVGDRLASGYVLQSVSGDSAVLVFGGNTVTLKLERNDKNSIKRKESVQLPQQSVITAEQNIPPPPPQRTAHMTVQPGGAAISNVTVPAPASSSDGNVHPRFPPVPSLPGHSSERGRRRLQQEEEITKMQADQEANIR